MILPIYSYGHAILRKPCNEIDSDYPNLEQLIIDMWETMYQAKGVGLAAPQIGLGIRIFIVDTLQSQKDDMDVKGIQQVFINPAKIDEPGQNWTYEEGCLSIPKLTGDVQRPEFIELEYRDESFDLQRKKFEGMNARVIQHEYDHLEGVLFIDRLKPLKKRLIKRKLEAIKEGQVDVEYRMKFKI